MAKMKAALIQAQQPSRTADELEQSASLSGQSRMGWEAYSVIERWQKQAPRSPTGYQVIGMTVWKRHFEGMRYALDHGAFPDPEQAALMRANLKELMRPFAYDVAAWERDGIFIPLDSMAFHFQSEYNVNNMVVGLYIFGEEHRDVYEAMRVLQREAERENHQRSLVLGWLFARAKVLLDQRRAEAETRRAAISAKREL